MFVWTIVKVALKSLVANKLRSFLAMLGIIIGVGSVISLLAIGTGAQKQVIDQVSSMGKNLLMVRPGFRGSGGVRSGSQQNLKLNDAQAILNKLSDIDLVSPVVNGNYQLKYFNKNTNSSLSGVASTYFPIRNLEVDKGRFFTENETDNMKRVVILGSQVSIDLFADNSPLNEDIKINGVNFNVIGVIKQKGSQGGSPDDQIFVPYKIAMKQLIGTDNLREIDVQAKDKADLTALQDSMTQLLRKRHRIQDSETDDFTIRNMAEVLQEAESFTKIFTILLGGIASISLLVGGIGIMNIMLVTVTERTREIGIRKAIGAKNKDILRQFLIEAIVMTTSGGLIGLLFGVSIANLVGKFTPFPPVVTISSIIISISFSMTVGLFFGYYPARRAAKLDPIEALRYE
ncbi:MAG: ABC transporter permease [Candidatus Sericytochromatia bacterium]|nr:ABC transporter permease [Candidatus Sericytochromatia bacterium]